MNGSHVHFRMKYEVFTGELPWQIDTEEHKKIAPPENGIWLMVPDILKELSETHAIMDSEVKYRFDNHSATEYLILEVYPVEKYPNERWRYDIFSCYCENFESQGPPPW